MENAKIAAKIFKSRDITISAFWVLESGTIQKSRICHSAAFAEESHIGSFYFVLLEILRYAQDDKSVFVGVICTVGRGDSPDRGNVCEADKRVPEFGEFCPRRGV